jgi:hypothetical protein
MTTKHAIREVLADILFSLGLIVAFPGVALMALANLIDPADFEELT